MILRGFTYKNGYRGMDITWDMIGIGCGFWTVILVTYLGIGPRDTMGIKLPDFAASW